MLRQRIITGVVLAVSFVAITFYSSLQIYSLILALLLIMAAWEWSALAGLNGWPARVAYVVVSVSGYGAALLAAYQSDPGGQRLLLTTLLYLSALVWLQIFFWMLRYPRGESVWGSSLIRVFLGPILLIPMFAGIFYLKSLSADGRWVLLVVMLIALADTGAYTAGKLFGKRKLAPQISPGKTIEGVAGGVFVNLLMACVLGAVSGIGPGGVVILALTFSSLSLVSVMGDLWVSMLKRHSGLKDTGHLLPGHGGILDRIDGWTSTVPAFCLAYVFIFPRVFS
jgi:phosphatidate cytidylyltransferase